MGVAEPRVIIRMGTHAEKDYLEKTIRFFDGLILGANLVEATPGATASLMLRFCGARRGLPYYIDPMTYAFGQYVDENGNVRDDLDWIKSEQKRGGKIVKDFKRSYKGLADAMKGCFEKAIRTGKSVHPSDFEGESLDECCRAVTSYQFDRIAEEFATVDELKVSEMIPRPAAVFAPYFYIEQSNADEWLAFNLKLAKATALVEDRAPVHAVVCVDESSLRDSAFTSKLIDQLPKTGVAAVWFWFSKFLEDRTTLPTLTAFRSLVATLSEKLDVYNMHGGYFSLALCKVGMSGISHGVGYGEQKDIMPVIGQSTPTVRYYLPNVHKRLGIAQIQRCFAPLNIKTPEDFYTHVCDCVVCRGVVSSSISQFSAFGDMHHSHPDAKRQAQTPAAAKRCRFHFLLCRIRERDAMRAITLPDVVAQLGKAKAKWGKFEWLSSELAYLPSWEKALA